MGPARVQGFRLKAVLAAVRAGGKQKAQALLDLLAENPYQQPPPYEALAADFCGACYRRINIQYRLFFQVQ
jgi:Txe/YoeB family toxin of Txe-Axe toxin-antitoxin module